MQEYKDSHNKDRKRELENIINRIKADFRTEIYRNDPKVKRLQKLTGELQILTTQTSIFEPSAKEKKSRQQQVQKLQTDIAALSAGIEEIKCNAIYRNAFEWRFEFPEVLDNDGNFEGFDVVIGNPPYLTGSNLANEKKLFLNDFVTAQYQIDLYILFIEKGSKLLNKNGFISFITPNSWLKNLMMSACRQLMLTQLKILSINPNIASAFDEASVDTLIFLAKNSSERGEIEIWEFSKNKESSLKSRILQQRFLSNDSYIFDVEVDNNISAILKKIRNQSVLLESAFEITRGVNPYDKYRGQSEEVISTKAYHASYKKDETFVPEIRGKHVQRYSYVWDEKHFISYGNWLAAAREKKYFTGDRIVFREILGKNFVCTIVQEDFIIDRSLYIAIPKTEGVDIEYVLGILSSKLLAWSFRLEKNEFDILFPKIRLEEFKKLPIRLSENQSTLARFVSEIITMKKVNPIADTTALEKQIDELVYQLYELTPEEISIIEKI